jgi:hypothetical protein
MITVFVTFYQDSLFKDESKTDFLIKIIKQIYDLNHEKKGAPNILLFFLRYRLKSQISPLF